MNNLIKNIIFSAITNLFKNQDDIFENTYQTNITEWNLSYHLSNELKEYIWWLNCDLDVTKRNYSNKRPDIIFHKRKKNSLNFLVIELKKNKHDNKSDIDKIKDDWMRYPLHYRYGAYVNIWGIDKYEAILFDRNKNEFNINKENCTYLEIPEVSKSLNQELNTLVEEIKESEINYVLNNDIVCLLEKLDIEIFKIFTKDVCT